MSGRSFVWFTLLFGLVEATWGAARWRQDGDFHVAMGLGGACLAFSFLFQAQLPDIVMVLLIFGITPGLMLWYWRRSRRRGPTENSSQP